MCRVTNAPYVSGARNSPSLTLEEQQSDSAECVRKATAAHHAHHRALSPVTRGVGPHPPPTHTPRVVAAELVAQPSETFLPASGTGDGDSVRRGPRSGTFQALPPGPAQLATTAGGSCSGTAGGFPRRGPPWAWGAAQGRRGGGPRASPAAWSKRISLRLLVTVGQGPAGVPQATICVCSHV